MLYQTALELTPALDFFSPPAASANAVEYQSDPNLRSLTRRSVPDFEHLVATETWTVEPYRGVEFHGLAESAGSGERRRRIRFHPKLAEVLGRKLSRKGLEPLEIAIGGRFEPYPSAERQFEVTRSVLRALAGSRGHQIDLTTRSPLVLRDQDHLARLDLSHAMTVRIPLPTLDPDLLARLEPGHAVPAARLEIVRSLARNGIAVVVACDPILPGLNNTVDELDPLFAAVRRAGAVDIVAAPPAAGPRHRRRISAWLEQHYPERASTVLAQLANTRGGTILGTFGRLRLSYGFPVHRAGRG